MVEGQELQPGRTLTPRTLFAFELSRPRERGPRRDTSRGDPTISLSIPRQRGEKAGVRRALPVSCPCYAQPPDGVHCPGYAK